MSNSPLVSFTKISPNRYSPRGHSIDTITIHCVVGQCTVEALGNLFSNASIRASSNYGIGYDGKVGMYVEEKDRSWCSSSTSNDDRAITIEVASDNKHPYAVNDVALASLIKLCADICKRNNIKKLLWKADKSLIGQVDKQNMTVHRWFANKACPGEYLYERHGYIADEVNKLLGSTPIEVVEENTNEFSPYTVTFDTATYYRSGPGTSYRVVGAAPKGVYTIVQEQDGWGQLKSKIGWVELSPGSTQSTFKPYTVRVTADALNYRVGPGTAYGVLGTITDKGVYTIVEVKNGWGLLKAYSKNRNGWINLDYTKKL